MAERCCMKLTVRLGYGMTARKSWYSMGFRIILANRYSRRCYFCLRISRANAGTCILEALTRVFDSCECLAFSLSILAIAGEHRNCRRFVLGGLLAFGCLRGARLTPEMNARCVCALNFILWAPFVSLVEAQGIKRA